MPFKSEVDDIIYYTRQLEKIAVLIKNMKRVDVGPSCDAMKDILEDLKAIVNQINKQL